MELRQLRYFVAVAHNLSFSKAANVLYLTQGTLSQQIQQLEAELGQELFERSSHKVVLTDAGMELLPLARNAIAASDLCLDRMKDLKKGLSGTINIGVTHSFSHFIIPVIKKFTLHNPGVKLIVIYNSASTLHEMLQAGMLDFILAYKSAERYDNVVSEPFTESRLAAIMRKGHELSDRSRLRFEDLNGYGIVLPRGGAQSRKVFDRFVNVDTTGLDVRIEVSDPTKIVSIIQGTNLIAILSTMAVNYNDDIVAVPLEGINTHMLGCVHWLKSVYRKRAAIEFVSMINSIC